MNFLDRENVQVPREKRARNNLSLIQHKKAQPAMRSASRASARVFEVTVMFPCLEHIMQLRPIGQVNDFRRSLV